MEQSTEIDKLLDALDEFNDNLSVIKPTSENSFLKNKYAPLPEVLKKIRKPLKEAGLTYLQGPTIKDGKQVIATRLIHKETKQWVEGTLELIHKPNEAQAQGSAVTYTRRYSIGTMLRLVIDNDDDGNAGSGLVKDKADKKQDTADFITLKSKLTKELMAHFKNIQAVKAFQEEILGEGKTVATPTDVKKVLKEFRDRHYEQSA